jgi:hypothetical protein
MDPKMNPKYIFSAFMAIVLIVGCIGLFGITTGKKVLPKSVDELAVVEVTVKNLSSDAKALTLETEEYPDTSISLMPSSPFNVGDTPESSVQAGDKIQVSLNKNDMDKLGHEKNIIAYELALPNGNVVTDSKEVIEGFSSPVMDYMRKASYAAVFVPVLYFSVLFLFPMLRRARPVRY